MAIFLFQMLAILGIFYFLIIRPKVQQEKKHRERLNQVKRGDEIVTAGGIVGEVRAGSPSSWFSWSELRKCGHPESRQTRARNEHQDHPSAWLTGPA
jgi:preprotein translocase YajC subunit